MGRRVEGDPSEQVCEVASTTSHTCLPIVHHQPPLLPSRGPSWSSVCLYPWFVRCCRDGSLVYEFEDVRCLFVGSSKSLSGSILLEFHCGTIRAVD